jgi:hypothetical protein
MRIVIHDVQTDGCTYSCSINVPLDYESPEAFERDFKSAAETAFLEKKFEFSFCGIDWTTAEHCQNDFTCSPSAYSLDAWFEKFKGEI